MLLLPSKVAQERLIEVTNNPVKRHRALFDKREFIDKDLIGQFHGNNVRKMSLITYKTTKRFHLFAFLGPLRFQSKE